jgi:flagellar hook-basal body complex protein FliE
MEGIRQSGSIGPRVEWEGSVKTDASSFANELGKAVGEVDRLQGEADGQADAIAKGKGNLHETALAFEKADVAMRLMIKVRNKIVDAYQEIMRMNV